MRANLKAMALIAALIVGLSKMISQWTLPGERVRSVSLLVSAFTHDSRTCGFFSFLET